MEQFGFKASNSVCESRESAANSHVHFETNIGKNAGRKIFEL